MSVESEINRISKAIADTYEILEGLGAAMPEVRNVDNLASTVEFFFNKWYSSTVDDGTVYMRSVYNTTKTDSTLYIE